MIGPEDVLSYWFHDIAAADYPASNGALWWGGSPAIDADIEARFGETYARALRGELTAWRATPRGVLAHVIVLDQFSRNLRRGLPSMYAADADAQELTLRALLDGSVAALLPLERNFLYMPLMHAENAALQRLSVHLFTEAATHARPADREAAQGTLRFAIRHQVPVERFGRFPHRNAILGRDTTPDEQVFLAEHPGGF